MDIDKTAKIPDDHSFPKLGLIASTGPLKSMPDEKEVERQLKIVLQKMDLPPETSNVLRDWKKWEMICDHVSLHTFQKCQMILCAVHFIYLPAYLPTLNIKF